MFLPLRIAWRYLFSKKGHNAINIISGVSAAAVCVVTAAMVCILSVMNGLGTMMESLFSRFDPELRVVASEGKTFRMDAPEVEALLALPWVSVSSAWVSDEVLLSYDERQVPAVLMGVDSCFRELTDIDSLIVSGTYQIGGGRFPRMVIGSGLASLLDMDTRYAGGVRLYAPKRVGRVNMVRPDRSFQQSTAFVSGEFAVNQTEYDDRIALVGIEQARELFEYDSVTATALALSVREGVRIDKAKKEAAAVLGPKWLVQDRYEQQADFFRMLRLEKLLTAILMVFILLIAGFNIIGSLSMLMIDKQEDVGVLRALGADSRLIQRIFLTEGWLISSLGAVAGLVLGVALCLVQERFGLIRFGSGDDYILSSYPVAVQWIDIVFTGITVLLLGWLTAWYPVRRFTAK
ncbi:MAG: ABC transporter permease [Paludibacteraceae bacterium]|nr:ABC transporter permease [Paludibacteraceae bacterium]